METELTKDIELYKKQVYEESPICRAYEGLLKFLRKLHVDFSANVDGYSVGNISPGYMDYSYFPFFNEELRSKKLRYGIVLNHRAMAFELWLMGQNQEVKLNYWGKLKSLKWNDGKTEMPIYPVLDTVIDGDPDFSDLEKLSTKIISAALAEVREINNYL